MWNGEPSSIHELVHTVGDFVGSIVLLVAGYFLSRHSHWKAELEKRLRKLEDWRIRIGEWKHRLEEWQLRLEAWQIRLEKWQLGIDDHDRTS